MDYEVGISDVYTIMGHPWLLDEMAYVGHMVNDGAMLKSCADGDATGESAASYLASSEELANAAHVDLAGCHAAVVATRAVKADEELFLTYGVEYWTSREIRMGELMGAAGASAAGVPSVRPP